MKKTSMLFSLCVLISLCILILSACGNNLASTVAASGNNVSVTSQETVDNRPTEKNGNTQPEEDTVSNNSDKDFEIKEYLYDDSYSSRFYLVVKNNLGYDVQIEGNAVAKDGSDNAIGAGNLDIDVIGPGQTSIGYFYFDEVTGISSVEYSLNYKTDLYFKDVLSNLSVKETVNKSNVIVSVTNNGAFPAEFVEAYALFFDKNGKVVYVDSEYLTDSDSEIKPNATLSAQLQSYEAFDHVEVYLTGRASNY